MDVMHVFRIASISKLITAVAIMKLQEEGKLTLQDRVFGRFQKLNEICSRYRTWIGNLPGNC